MRHRIRSSTACTTLSYADNAWHHVVYTRTASSKALVIYVDGTSRGLRLDRQHRRPVGLHLHHLRQAAVRRQLLHRLTG